MNLHSIKYNAEAKSTKVQGVLKLSKVYFPFHYHVRHDEDFDHKGYVDELETKAKRWEKKLDKLSAWADKKSEKLTHKKSGVEIDVTIHDCTLIPEASDDWRLFCKVESDGEMHRFNFHYKDPDDAMSVAELKGIIATAIEEHAVVKDKLGKHKEKLDALASEAQEKTPRVFGGV